jgi:hypothetical protein
VTTKTTERLRLPRPLDKLDQLSSTAIAVVYVCLLLIIGAIGRNTSPSRAAAVPTPALPTIIIASPVPAVPLVAPAPMQQMAPIQPAIPQYVTAWASPGGDVLGPIPEPPTSALLGRWGDGWVATTWQGNTVWLRAADLGLNLANVQPQIAPAP